MLTFTEDLPNFIEDIPIGIVSADPTGKLPNCYNQYVLDMFGWTPEEGSTREQWFRLVLPDDDYRNEVITKWLAMIEDTKARNLKFSEPLEAYFSCKGGAAKWCTVRYYNYGELSYAIFTDISELKRTQDALQQEISQKKLLLRELNHRVKNNLQVVSSIISLQVSKKDTSRVLEEMENRIAAISLAYDKLIFPDHSDEVDLNLYLESFMGQLIDGKYDLLKKNLTVPKIEIDIQKAVSIGLIISECYSNTIKHAFEPDFKNPLFSVNIVLNGDLLTVVISDNGQGFKADMQTCGNGLEIVTSLCKKRFNALPKFFNDNGAIIQFSMKI